MKTKTVELYTDLWPDWHEFPASQYNIWASSQPCGEKPAGALRVKITVELPEHSRSFPVNESVKGLARVE